MSSRRLGRRCSPGMLSAWALLLVAVFLGQANCLADLDDAKKELLAGRYDACIAAARTAIADRQDREEWAPLLVEALMARGRYADAFNAATNALASEPQSIRLRWTAREAALALGETSKAAALTEEIQQLFVSRSWLYREPRDLIVFGRVALLGGMDPKMVLDRLYDRVKRATPALRDIHLACGELALAKHDYALAAKFYQEGLKQLPDDPDLHVGLAKAYAPSEPKLALGSLEAALNLNSNHVASLLMLIDHAIDAEEYTSADKMLDQIESVNPWQPEAWAYRAVIAHLRNQLRREVEAREMALKFWRTNPRVDHLIGLKLSQKYRFALGATHQKTALSFDPNYLPAKGQLAQDLLRLGEEADGWRLADEVQQADAYDVAANNLVALHGVIQKYGALTNEHFILRMEPRELALYGPSALELLTRALEVLGPKYGFDPEQPTLVEIFHNEKDFAVRTFGMPDNDGFLGVCFGNVITANSPGSRAGRQFNWQSMLWHEFCHVVTLQLTRNRMPRWLSEGISVYEERQADPAWGEHLNPRYREMLLGDELTSVSKLSGAFLNPKTPQHLQFAYYESSLVVQFILEKYGPDKLRKILAALADGSEINEALPQQTEPMPDLERKFQDYARQVALKLAPGLDWERPGPEALGLLDPEEHILSGASPPRPVSAGEAWLSWANSHPSNYWVLTKRIDTFLQDKKWAEAKPLLKRLVDAYPASRGEDKLYEKLAYVHRSLGETNEEFEVLGRAALHDDTAMDAFTRLMELGTSRTNWAVVLQTAERYLAVNPLVPLPYRHLAQAAVMCRQPERAIQAYRALLQLDSSNPADLHFRLAELLQQSGDPQAKRHLLQSLEEAPRHREALRLLRELHHRETNAPPSTPVQASR